MWWKPQPGLAEQIFPMVAKFDTDLKDNENDRSAYRISLH